MPKLEFTIVYDWLAKRRDISHTEKIVIAHILRYDKNEYGCFKSNGNIAKALGFSKYHGRVTVIRIINRLEDEGWIVRKKYPHRERSLFINQEKLDGMPLLAGIKGRKKVVSTVVNSCGKPVNSLAGASGSQPLSSGSQPLGGSGSQPLCLNRNSKECLLLNINERKEREKFSQLNMRQRSRLTKAEFEARRQKYHEQLEKL